MTRAGEKWFLAGIVGVAALGMGAAAGGEPVGDPLPPGALVRLGTVRLRHPGGALAVAFAPDGKTLASGGLDGTVRLWDAATGQEIRRFRGHQDIVSAVAFSPDGRKLASGSWDGTGLVWGLTAWDRTAPAGPLGPKQVQALWDDLGGKDATRADRAFWSLVAAPKEAAALVRDRLAAAPLPADAARVRRLIAELDAEEFDAREKAEAELKRLGANAAPALREVLAGKPSAEARRRIEGLLSRLEQKGEPLPPRGRARPAGRARTGTGRHAGRPHAAERTGRLRRAADPRGGGPRRPRPS
jgi:hypothetical protein